jgi:ABC-2 type transport system ATP-binding protein
MLALEDISRSFGGMSAVDGLSLTARRGEIFGLLGPNGAGKTTTIRIIMGILAPDRGQVTFDGSPLRREDSDLIGYLPEERGLYRKVRVHEMLCHLGELKNMSRRGSEEAVNRWLERFGMEEWRRARVRELSKGMAQKIQFIGSLLHDPQVLILDEPFSGLDPVSMETLRETVSELRRRGKTILFSTHVMEQAEQLCDRLVLIDRGRAVADGTLGELHAAYGSRAVTAEFEEPPADSSPPPGTRLRSRSPRTLELQLSGQTDSRQVLMDLAERGALRRFEFARPSLHSIFVDLVKRGEDNA